MCKLLIHRSDRHRREPRMACRWRGAAMIEAVFVLFILLVLTFGTVEFGYFFFVKHSLQGAAREGARAAIVPSADNNAVLKAVVDSLHLAGLNNSSLTLDSRYTLKLTPANVATAAQGSPVTVELSAKWVSYGVRPLGDLLIKSDKIVKGTTTMRKE
jgi:Flp pilus assembly protein TadG